MVVEIQIPRDPSGPICDFCSDPLLMATDFYCHPFSLFYPNGEEYVDSGVWAACPTCVPLVQARDEKAIMQRLVNRFPRLPLGTARAMLNAFWSNQI